MTRTPAALFRAGLSLYVGLVIATILASALRIGYSEAMDAFARSTPSPLLARVGDGTAAAIGLMVLAVLVAIAVGLYLFKPWGRALALWTSVLAFPLYLALGPTVSSVPEAMLFDASNMLWGALLASAYWSPAAACFTRAADGARLDA